MTRYLFYPNALGYALIFILLAALLLTVPVALAQEEPLATNTPAEEPAPTAAPEPLPDELPDVVPVVDESTEDLNAFLVDAKVVIALLVVLLTQLLKFLLPTKPGESEEEKSARSQRIYLGVIGLFSALYFIGSITGYLEQIQRGINFLAVLADPVWQIIIAVGGSGLVYMLGRATNNVALAGRQSAKAFQLDPPKPVQMLMPRTLELSPLLESTGDSAARHFGRT